MDKFPRHSSIYNFALPLMLVTALKHRAARKRRANKLSREKVNDSFTGSWF